MWTYDDWGGWYDHVKPPQVDRYGYGFRAPALLVSPYAKQRPRRPHDARLHVDAEVHRGQLGPEAARLARPQGEEHRRGVRLHPAAARARVPLARAASRRRGGPAARAAVYVGYGSAAIVVAALVAAGVACRRRRRLARRPPARSAGDGGRRGGRGRARAAAGIDGARRGRGRRTRHGARPRGGRPAIARRPHRSRPSRASCWRSGAGASARTASAARRSASARAIDGAGRATPICCCRCAYATRPCGPAASRASSGSTRRSPAGIRWRGSRCRRTVASSAFVDRGNGAIESSSISRYTLKSRHGVVLASKGGAAALLQSSRVVPFSGHLVSKPIEWSVESVIVDGATSSTGPSSASSRAASPAVSRSGCSSTPCRSGPVTPSSDSRSAEGCT